MELKREICRQVIDGLHKILTLNSFFIYLATQHIFWKQVSNRERSCRTFTTLN